MKPAILTAITLVTLSSAAFAETPCMSAAEMEAGLIDWYGETPVDGATRARAQMWASEETGTWTLVQYLADGNACVVAQGDDWAPARTDDLLIAVLDN
ncbi:S-adenosyl-L-homocysteine hydrolase [Tateyamaria sp. SN3-11]|uniref:S-adenosyl-L-homocysteine hydrolase n=1 Tax=Tateyamaria sp. SN3-11 TaxID=3092147 RepID=UPI0039E9A924